MLADSPYTNRTAGDREAGARCPHCAAAIAHGEEIVACLRCGAVHHVVCWHSHDGCGSFDCAPARRVLSENRQPELRITVDEVARVQPPPRPVVVPASYFPGNSAGSRLRLRTPPLVSPGHRRADRRLWPAFRCLAS